MKNLALLSLIGILDCGSLASQIRISDFDDNMRSSPKTYRLTNESRYPFTNQVKKSTNNNIPCMPICYLYHYNGKLAEMGTWMNSKWVGKYKSYYDNGNARTELNYDNEGRRDGIQRFYHETGELFKECVYSQGKELNSLIVLSKPSTVTSRSVELFKFQKRIHPKPIE
jgi:hypothetical protein